MVSSRAGAVAAIIVLASGCGVGLGVGASGAHRGALSADSATSFVVTGRGFGYVTGYSKVERAAFGESLSLGLYAGQKGGWARGTVTGQSATASGYAGEQHVDLVLSVGRFGLILSASRLQHFLDYAGEFRVENRGYGLVPRLGFAPLGWLSVYAGAGPIVAGRVSVGHTIDESMFNQLFFRQEAAQLGSGSTSTGFQGVVGIDVTVWQVGAGKFGLRTEGQILRFGTGAVAGSAPIGLDSKALVFELYLGLF